MKHKLALSLLVLSGALVGGQRAAAEYKLNFRPGFDISYVGGNNSYFWDLFADQRQLENGEQTADSGYSAGTYAARPNPYYAANQVARYPQGYAPYYTAYQAGVYPQQAYQRPGVAVPMHTVGYSPYTRPVYPYYYYPSSMPNAYWYGR